MYRPARDRLDGRELIGTFARPGPDPDFSLMPELFPTEVQSQCARLRTVRAPRRRYHRQRAPQSAGKARQADALERALDDAARTCGPPRRARSSIAARKPPSIRNLPRARAARPAGVSARRPGPRLRDLAAICLIYCQFAAAPIGRYMLELSGEDLAVCGRPADALCAALRILKQLRDCGDPTDPATTAYASRASSSTTR